MRWQQTTAPVGRQLDSRLVLIFTIPKLAGDLLVLRIECLAIVGVNANPDLLAQAEFNLEIPVRIGNRLSCCRYNVRLAVGEHAFRFNEAVNAAGCNDRCRQSRITNGVPDFGNRRKIAAEGAPLVRDVLRHAFIATAPGVWIRCGTYFRLFGIFKLAAA